MHTHIAIIGAGFGGLGLAARLKIAQINDFIIFDKGAEVGGIWYWNTYPGCGCDVPSHLYSFSFAPYRNPRIRYPAQPDILAYLRDIANRFNVRPHLRLSTEVISVRWDDDAGLWALVTAAGDDYTADVVVFAVGQLHRPYIPNFAGHEVFNGRSFHTAEWDHSCDLKDASVAVLGTGSSAAQMIPHLAKQAKNVYVYQRTANWVLPKPSAKFSRPVSALFHAFPGAHAVYRHGTRCAADVVLTPVLTRGWSARLIEMVARWHLRRQVPDLVLRRKLTPTHTLGCKRIVVDSNYYQALNQSNVTLITEPIKRITPIGIGTIDGVQRSVDAIVYATGYRTTEFLVPIQVSGRGGIDLHGQWRDGAEAYLGMTLPHFPNMFFVHGPNTILGHNSNIYMIELQTEYILRCLKTLQSQDTRCALETRPFAMEKYRAWLASAIRPTVWVDNCRSWYKTSEGRVTNPWPASTQQYRRMARQEVLAAQIIVPLE